MRRLNFLFVLAFVVFSCNGLQTKNSNKLLSFIPGTYTRVFEGEFSKGHDTLSITRPDENNNYYLIAHNSSYQKIRAGQLQAVEYKSENWTAIYNEKDNVLVEQKKGKLISFLPEQDALLLGSNRFNKIK